MPYLYSNNLWRGFTRKNQVNDFYNFFCLQSSSFVEIPIPCDTYTFFCSLV